MYFSIKSSLKGILYSEKKNDKVIERNNFPYNKICQELVAHLNHKIKKNIEEALTRLEKGGRKKKKRVTKSEELSSKIRRTITKSQLH